MRANMVVRLFGALTLVVGGLGLSQDASAGPMVSIVGTEDWQDGDPLGPTLTGGFITGHQAWTHTYAAVPVGDIISATITIDLIDADAGRLQVYAGVNTSGQHIGNASGNDAGVPGPWRPVGSPYAPETTLTIPSSLHADLADGSFAVYGYNSAMSWWGSNRSRLEIEVIPEPATMGLLGLGMLGVFLRRKRR